MITTELVSTIVLTTALRSRESVKTVLKFSSPANDWYSPSPKKLFSPGRWMFQFRVEMARVSRNGICVTMMVKISAGSSGPRRDHRSLAERCAGGGPVGVSVSLLNVAVMSASG